MARPLRRPPRRDPRRPQPRAARAGARALSARARRRLRGGGPAWLAVALLGAACAAPPAEPADAPVAELLRDPAALQRGQRLFLGACAGYCHAVRAQAGGEAPDLFDCEWLHGGSDAEIFATIAGGVPGTQMEAFGAALARRDIWTVVAYLRSESSCRAPLSP